MGSLPKARTATLTSADPFPSALGNELQDMHVGDKRTFFKRQFFPSCWHASGTPPTLVNNPASPTGPDVPVWLVPTAQTIITRIPYYPGEQVSGVSGAGSPGFQIEVYGDGAADFTAVLRSIAGLNTTSGATVIVNDGRTNQAASWSTVNLSVDVEIPLPDPGALYLSIAVSSGTQIYIGQIIPLFTRP